MLDKHSTGNDQAPSEELRVNTQKDHETLWTLDTRTHSPPVMEKKSVTTHAAPQVSIPRNGEQEKPWTLDADSDNQRAKKGASVSEARERERPWTLDDDGGDSASIRGRSTTSIASAPQGQVNRTDLAGHVHDSSAETKAPVGSRDTISTEPRWSLGSNPHDAAGTTSRPRSIIGASWVKRSLEQQRLAAKYPFDPDDSTTFGRFAISNHRNNLVMEVREHMTALTRVTRLVRRVFRAVLGREADASQENDGYYRRPEPEQKGATQTSYRISLAELQRVHLRKLQCKLVKHVVDMRFRDMEPADWEADLQAYTSALKDYDYMLKSSQTLRDNFLVTGERLVDDLVIRSMLNTSTCPVKKPICPKPDRTSSKRNPEKKDSETGQSPPIEDKLNDGNLKYFVSVDGPWETADWTVPIGGTRSENRAKSRAMQLQTNGAMAVLGGAFLVCPMWLMVLRESLYLCLITTTGCVVLFGAVMAVMVGEPKDVFSSTAAYAAVLVVFVGLSNS